MPSRQINAILQKKKQKIIELVARPMGVEVCRGLTHFGADLAFDGPGIFRLQGRRGHYRDQGMLNDHNFHLPVFFSLMTVNGEVND